MENCSLSEWYQNTEFYNWKGNQIVFKKSETAKPWLLLIHGFPTASFDWWKLWGSLSNHFSLIAPDMLGFGYSDKPRDFRYTIHSQADLIEELLQQQGIENCHILAHDYGDTVAQELMARFNGGDSFEIESVCLLNGGIFPEAHQALLIQKLLMGPFGFIISALLTKKKFQKNFSSIFGRDSQLTEAELDEYWELVTYNKGHRIAHLLSRYRKERIVHRNRWVGALQKFQKPLALINGPADPISGQTMIDRYMTLIKDPLIWRLEGSGHYPQLEQPEELLKGYYEFLKK